MAKENELPHLEGRLGVAVGLSINFWYEDAALGQLVKALQVQTPENLVIVLNRGLTE
ncbi:hypothetical protein GCM10007390_17070 [Persicitalea jodogahamensis]|uniref:Uncharacterized protein n=1 Tax=Persicitalea jodogahamensis TaxID=402147 RepID=A0A8J3D5R0_9BACT|nr:hypothetical protein GCM10007390_17070 [Persicitalea jodogahamensis]